MVEFNVRGTIFSMDDAYVNLSDYLRVIMEGKFLKDLDEEGRFRLDFDPQAFRNYKLYLEGKNFKIDGPTMELFEMLNISNPYNYPIEYWKNKLMDDLIKDNWDTYKKTIKLTRTLPIVNALELDDEQYYVGDYYIVGDAVLYMAGYIKGVRNVQIISNNKGAGIVVDAELPEVNMEDLSNIGKSPYLSNPPLSYERLDSITAGYICYTGICDADLIVYSSKYNKIYCTTRCYNALKNMEVWLEPDKMSDVYANRLVTLYAQGFTIKLPYHEDIKINTMDIADDVILANENTPEDEDMPLFDTDIQAANYILYNHSMGYTSFQTPNNAPIDRIIATTSKVIYYGLDTYTRIEQYDRNKDADITDLYLTCRYIDKISLIGDISLLEYQYNRYIGNRDFNTPSSFGFKDYPDLYRDIVYLCNTDQDDLVFLGHTKTNLVFYGDRYVSGTNVAIELNGIMSPNTSYLINFDGVSYDEYDRYAFDVDSYRPRTYFLDDDPVSLREAVKYSKIDLDQIAYAGNEGGAYCSLLFLYAYYHMVHTITKETKLNVIHRLKATYGNKLTFYAPGPYNPVDIDPYYLSDALYQLALYTGEYEFEVRFPNRVMSLEELEEFNEALERIPKKYWDLAKERYDKFIKHTNTTNRIEKFIGYGLEYIGVIDYKPEVLLNVANEPDESMFYLYPFDHYDTIGSGYNELHELDWYYLLP